MFVKLKGEQMSKLFKKRDILSAVVPSRLRHPLKYIAWRKRMKGKYKLAMYIEASQPKEKGTGSCEALVGIGEPEEGGDHNFNSYGFCYWCGAKQKETHNGE